MSPYIALLYDGLENAIEITKYYRNCDLVVNMSSSKTITKTAAEDAEESQFSSITKSPEMWKSISSTIMTIVEKAHFEDSPEGVTFRSMDPSHIALIDINGPSSAFEKFHCPSVIKFGIRIDDFSKVIKRAGTNDSIEVNVQDN